MLDRKTDNRTAAVICVLLAAVTLIVFGRTLSHEFVNYDDPLYVVDNPMVLDGLSPKGVAWAFTHFHAGNWHPLTWLSHMLDCQLYGLDAGGHHLTNVVLHAAAAILLFLVLRGMTGALWRSAVVAAVFAIHPLRVESVAWISERKDVLSGLFFVLTIGAYARYAARPFSLTRYLAVGLSFALGLMSKPMLVTLPALLLLLDYWPLKRFSVLGFPSFALRATAGKRFSDGSDDLQVTPCPSTLDPPVSIRPVGWLLVEKIPLFALSAAVCVVTVLAVTETSSPIEELPFLVLIGNALVSYAAYLGQMVYPVGLAAHYPFSTSGAPLVVISVVLLGSISAVAFVWRTKYPYLPVGWLWYLGMLVPVIGLVQTGVQSRADRYTYLPQIGLYILLTWAAFDVSAAWRRRRLVFGTAVTAVLAALMVCAWIQTSHWRNSESLWTHTIACTSQNYVARTGLGNVLLEQERIAEAIEHYEEAVRIKPDLAKTHSNLGLALVRRGSLAEAIEQFLQALRIKPDDAEAHNNLGNIRVGQGNIAEAVEHFHQALRTRPDYAEAYNNLGSALERQGKIVEAVEKYRRALRIKSDLAEAHYNLGNVLQGQGKIVEAIQHFYRALQIEPDDAMTYYRLGHCLQRQGKVVEAIEHYHQALRIKPDFAKAHTSLGAALGKEGDIPAAVRQYTRALDLNPDIPTALNNLAWIRATHPDEGLRDGTRAVELAERSCELTHHRAAGALDTLAAAYAEAGRFDAAIKTAASAIDAATAAGDEKLVREFRGRAELYGQGVPYREANK
jgi:tetratricopeptide (TPR) repeat protein